MQIYLTKQCKTLTGSVGRGFGYYIRRFVTRFGAVYFHAQRSKHKVPPDGHLRFIFACAEMAQAKLHIEDISVSPSEICAALSEAGKCKDCPQSECPVKLLRAYSAADIIKLKNDLGL